MSRVLVPVRVLEGETIDPGLIELLAGDHVVLLGYHEIPEQTAPEQARDSFGERAQPKLDDISTALEDAGARVDSRLVFTHDAEQTQQRVADETDCDAVVTLGSAMAMDHILVVLHPDAAVSDIASFAAEHVKGTDREISLLSITDDESASGDALAAGETSLTDAGVTEAQITVDRTATESPLDRIVDAATGTDLVVIGERPPSTMDRLIGDFVDRIAAETVGPVAVVRTRADEE